jgi:thioester reductase-like protein
MASFPETQSSEIIKFYKNKSIFITGATGFVGKVLIEKLLRSCYDLNKIYILIRIKKGHTAVQRLNELVNCKVSILQENTFFLPFSFFF